MLSIICLADLGFFVSLMQPFWLCCCRGHTVKAVCESFQMSKDAGFKVVAHMMPDLPNVGWERDVEQFKVIQGRDRL